MNRKNLEESRSNWIALTMLFGLFFIIMGIALVISGGQKTNLEEQLSDLEEQYENQIGKDIWTLEYFCNWESIGETHQVIYTFNNYGDYLEQFDFVESILMCEIKGEGK